MWRCVADLLTPKLCLTIDQVSAILMVWSPSGVEIIAGKGRHKIFRQRQGVLTMTKSFDAFCDEGGVVEKRYNH